MATSARIEIESRFAELSAEAQLRLLERLVHRTHEAVAGRSAAWDSELASMAADPQMQRELKRINSEFQITEADDLGGL